MRERLEKLAEQWPIDIPFERAIRKHRTELNELISEGLTWTLIARTLTVAGVRKKTGAPMTAKQMNTVYLRVSRSQPKQRRSREIDDYTIIARSRNLAGNETPTSPSKSVSALARTGVCTHMPSSPNLVERLSEATRLQKSRKFDFDE